MMVNGQLSLHSVFSCSYTIIHPLPIDVAVVNFLFCELYSGCVDRCQVKFPYLSYVVPS